MKKRWTALACTLCLCASLTLPAAAAGGYTDVPGGAWYEAAVNEVTEKGYMTGVSEGQFAPTANVTRATVVTVLWRMEGRGDFKPDQSVTRQELAAFLTRFDQYRGVPLAEGSLNLYSDANMTGVWAVESMRHAVGMGWLEGDGGRLLPGGVATRAQLAVILQRLTTQAMG